jgi:hypothetical protein
MKAASAVSVVLSVSTEQPARASPAIAVMRYFMKASPKEVLVLLRTIGGRG